MQGTWLLLLSCGTLYVKRPQRVCDAAATCKDRQQVHVRSYSTQAWAMACSLPACFGARTGHFC